MKRSLILVVLDGWGIGRNDESNPIHTVDPESFRYLKEHFPMTSLQASGISVGLPWGEVGNSEVGHLTLGAGKVLYQHFPRITLSIRDGTFFENAVLKDAFRHARKNNAAANVVGLLSMGNVHASLEHLQALIKMAGQEHTPVKLHLFSDGKDSPPHTLQKFLAEIPREKMATLIGRYYAMDREKNWQLTEKTYEALTAEEGRLIRAEDLDAAINEHYETGRNEEFLPPLRIGEDARIKDGESVIFFNYREDSIRQISEAFILQDFDKFPVKKFQDLFIATMTPYEERYAVPVISPPEQVENPLGKVLSMNGKTQLRVTETYKYAHVTFFFNGYRETPFQNEYRVLIPSLAAARIEEHPEMRATAITDRIIEGIEGKSFDFVLANYANGDTIAHTGNYESSLEAVRVIDREIGRLIKSALRTDAILLITSDHGNIEQVLNPMTAYPETQHDPSPVPFHIVASEFNGRTFTNQQDLSQTAGMLSDVAPTILSLMGLAPPKEMTGHNILERL